MNTFTKILFLVWMVLAIASFVVSFWAPLLIKIIGIAFGSLNLMIIGSWTIATLEGIRENKKQKSIGDGLQV